MLEDATQAYKAEALELQRQLRHLQSQFDMLTGQASALIQGRRARVAATSTVNGQLTMIDDSLSARNLQMVMGCDVIPSLIRAVGSWDLHLGACQNTFLRGSCGVLDDIGSQFNNERVVPGAASASSARAVSTGLDVFLV
ncbi:AUGMIN subunit 3 [Vitis vinifera]|uniref:AUGMIN subunit 3 n=1 Tax=Vitis vinifera TaxID=29760 RepID=A0A438HW65_VITVI|nr:AUGMIN subunit 3 [Vitis vinifera]